MIVPDILALGCARYPEDLCISDRLRSLSFSELDEEVARVELVLRAHGVAAGDRVGLVAKNCIEFASLQIALQRMGAALAPANYRLGPAEIAFIYENCAARLVIYAPEFESALATLSRLTLPLPDFARDVAAATLSASGYCRRPVEGERIGQLLYTSGTTGRPKGVMISNLAMYMRMASYAAEMRASRGRQLIQILPMFHLASSFSYAYLLHGGSTVLMPDARADSFWELVRGHADCDTLLVPTVLDMLLTDERLAVGAGDGLKTIYYGSAAMPSRLHEKAAGLLTAGFSKFYGLTEAGAATMLGREEHCASDLEAFDRCVGHDMIGFETAVLGPEGETVEPGVHGEVCIRGPSSMSGYWEDDAADRDARYGDWIRTGDGGYKGRDGRLYLSDRLKDIVKSGGENVSAAEVEYLLREQADIADCAIVGVPDDALGERVHAFVVPSDPETFDLGALERAAKAAMAGYKRPRSWTVARTLPRNSLGKVVKPVLRRALADGSDATDLGSSPL